MPKPPEETTRGLALLLRPPRSARQDAAEATRLRALGQEIGRRLSGDFLDLYGLRSGFGPDPGAQAPAEPGPGLTLRLAGPDGFGRCSIGQSALYDLAEALFGGDGSCPPYREARATTDLERAMGCALAPVFATALGAALERDDIAFERLAGADEPIEPEQATIALKMRLLGRDGRLAFICPRGWLGLEPVAAPASQERLTPEAVTLDLKVCLPDRGRILGDLVGLAEGVILPLSLPAQAPVVVEADGVALFHATLGQSAGRYTLRIERAVAAAAGSAPA